jgi:glycosyltransferase involved in cell wall biosynthesis
VIVGDGALRDRLEQQSQSLGLAADVVFLGNRRDIENVYPALDIVALTSLNEGTPLTLIEAMANARPVISTMVGGVIDLLGDAVPEQSVPSFVICRRGIGVPSNDARAFAEGLAHLVANAGLGREIGERGLQFVESHYSKDRLLEDIRALYADLLKGKAFSVKAQATEKSVNPRASL